MNRVDLSGIVNEIARAIQVDIEPTALDFSALSQDASLLA
jgi:hypothetical protein